MLVKEVDLLKYAMGTPPEHKQEVHSCVRILVLYNSQCENLLEGG